MLNIFELWLALAGVISGIVYFYDPASLDTNSVSRQIGFGLAVVWNVAYFLAGISVGYGLLRPNPRSEIFGLWILGGTTAVNGVSILSVFGFRGAATSITLLTLTAATWTRAVFVYNAVNRLSDEFDVSHS